MTVPAREQEHGGPDATTLQKVQILGGSYSEGRKDDDHSTIYELCHRGEKKLYGGGGDSTSHGKPNVAPSRIT